MDISMSKKKIKIKKQEDPKIDENYEVDQPQSPNSAAVQTIIEEPVHDIDETPLNLVNK